MPPAIDQKVGIAQSVRSGLLPLNALRHTPEEGTSGWFIWAGAEPSSDPAFFAPLHVSHASEWCPEIVNGGSILTLFRRLNFDPLVLVVSYLWQ
jgi:hypothetical protein